MRLSFLLCCFFAFTLRAQDKSFMFSPDNSIFRDTVDCWIGSLIRVDNIYVNLSKDKPIIELEQVSSSHQILNKVPYIDSTTNGDPRTLFVRAKLNQFEELTHYLVMKVTAKDFFSKKTYTAYDYWVIKPQYPILTPIYQPIYYAGDDIRFSFIAAGLNEDTSYSYEITGPDGIIKSEKGKYVVSLDANDESFFNKEFTITGLYNGKKFIYKSSQKDEKPDSSEWKVKILGPSYNNLEVNAYTDDINSAFKISLVYRVGIKEYTPNLDISTLKVKIGDDVIPSDNISISNKDKRKILSMTIPPKYNSGNLNGYVEFNDQYRTDINKPLSKSFTLTLK